jgi:hypothetical protein
MKTKKYHRDDPKIIEILINKELEKYNITYNDIIKNPKINDVDWYQHYTFDNTQEYETWKSFCKNFLQKEVTPKFTNIEFDKFWPMFDLGYGLKLNY